MPVQIDDLDARILALLHEDARSSLRSIARRLGVSTPTVSARVRKLEDRGVVTGYRVELNPDVAGGPETVVRLRVAPAAARTVADAVAAAAEDASVAVLTGGAVEVRIAGLRPEEAPRRLEALAQHPEVVAYELENVLHVVRRRATAVPRPGDPLLLRCFECRGPLPERPVRATLDGREHLLCCATCKRDHTARYRRLSERSAGAAKR